MMSRIRKIVLATAVFLSAAASAVALEQARLTIGEDAYNVPIGKPFAVRIGGKRMTLRIDPQNDHEFSEAGVSFRHPAKLKPSDDAAGEGVTIWTLQGRNAAVMLQRYEGGIDAKSLLEVLVGNLIEQEEKGGSVKRQGVKLTGPERVYQGVQLRTTTPAKGPQPATQGVQNVFTFANKQGVFALILQDVRAEGEEESSEYNETLRLLGESLKTGAVPKPPATPDKRANGTKQKR